jgi:hypothetical protein
MLPLGGEMGPWSRKNAHGRAEPKSKFSLRRSAGLFYQPGLAGQVPEKIPTLARTLSFCRMTAFITG